LSNRKLVQDQKAILEKRLSDLVALNELFAKQKKDFCPPPSMVSLLLNQMLFVTHTIPRVRKIHEGNHQYFSTISEYLDKSDAKVVSQVIEFVVIPGLLSPDNNLDPSMVWLESNEGKMKFLKLVRLCTYLILARHHKLSKKSDVKRRNTYASLLMDEEGVKVIYKMILVLVGNGNSRRTEKEEMTAFCRRMFLSSVNHSHHHPILLGKRPIMEENFDLISLLRTFFLFPSGLRVNVIPANAETLREECIVSEDRFRADGFYNMISNIVLESNDVEISARFFSEVFTVPLLTWRLEGKTIDFLVGKCKDRSKDSVIPPFITLMESFLKYHENSNLYDIDKLLPPDDVVITICPSPPVLSLCANMSQLGAACPKIYTVDKFHSTFEGEFEQ
jgi:hypothetical protein